MILNLGLPDTDGKAVIETVRLRSTLPIIVLLARDQEMEKIMALDLGADDFVAKPFAIGELLARLRVCLPPARTLEPETRLRLGPLVRHQRWHRTAPGDLPMSRMCPTCASSSANCARRSRSRRRRQ